MHKNKISVYEYDKLKVGKKYDGVLFSETLLEKLERFHSSSKIRYFNLIRNGVEFCEYVGVIQIGNIQIEILPKLDKENSDTGVWRNRLIGMLREVGMFKVSAPSTSMLTLRANSILDLYFEIFIAELEYLLRTGLIKQYRKHTHNQNALKGAIYFPKHIAKNVVHKEKFFTKVSIYDYDHVWHAIFVETIKLIKLISQNTDIHNRIGDLELNFPEVRSQRVTESTFALLCYNRKTESYRDAIEIARLLLLGFHPDLATGSNSVLALMFDMNLLWESFIYHSLKKQFLRKESPYLIIAQTSTPFWQSSSYRKYLRPDILIECRTSGRRFVLDTKWKIISDSSPSPTDLQQLFAYSQFFKSTKNALVYPGFENSVHNGRYMLNICSDNISCAMVHIGVEIQIHAWQESIYEAIIDWMQTAD